MYRYLPTVFLFPHVRLRNSRLDASVVTRLSMALAHKWLGVLLGCGAPGWALSKLSFDSLPTSSQYSLTKMIDNMSESLATHHRVIREKRRHPGLPGRSISEVPALVYLRLMSLLLFQCWGKCTAKTALDVVPGSCKVSSMDCTIDTESVFSAAGPPRSLPEQVIGTGCYHGRGGA